MDKQVIERKGLHLTLYRAFFNGLQATDLFDRFMAETPWKQEQIKFYSKIINIPRLTAWYSKDGLDYTYSGIKNKALPFTQAISETCDLLEHALYTKFNSVLLNLYRNGQDSVSSHSDNERELGLNPIIASLSLGQTRTFKLSRKDGKDYMHLPLSHGDLLVMDDETQTYWDHEIPKEPKITKPRINLTFRYIKGVKNEN